MAGTPRGRRTYASPACLLGDPGTAAEAAAPRVHIKRIYDRPQRSDGFRVLVDRLWPRGVRKDAAKLAAWAKELAPSTQLRKWFAHDPTRWREFERRYRKELRERAVELEALRNTARRRRVTLLYAAKDPERNHALVLKAAIESSPTARSRRP